VLEPMLQLSTPVLNGVVPENVSLTAPIAWVLQLHASGVLAEQDECLNSNATVPLSDDVKFNEDC